MQTFTHPLSWGNHANIHTPLKDSLQSSDVQAIHSHVAGALGGALPESGAAPRHAELLRLAGSGFRAAYRQGEGRRHAAPHGRGCITTVMCTGGAFLIAAHIACLTTASPRR
jgi:hypothetical protein